MKNNSQILIRIYQQVSTVVRYVAENWVVLVKPPNVFGQNTHQFAIILVEWISGFPKWISTMAKNNSHAIVVEDKETSYPTCQTLWDIR